ncbi:AMP-binding protein [Corynebacterium sp. 320]|uniref:TIGR03089 family protein n=1 Tax=Corynebacterium TaxID=1716 RepID=UPI00125CBDCA|nr:MULTISPECIES: TIGR03089 family protein [Corynebacterium]KAB1504183.1 AMP-binding protein [Corynebacterium sp. 320]KAB1552717.1 AMP-binding protein [Corynebacterium sp. 321]KAB1554065.1 AMP-binding protein [Corynebacterium sp. 319]KAB3528319.1 AMP-binding protein [Corynebacterium sp. 250]KAB3540192.1 AMP-binding protein [Corynebacterium sp. 366]
MDIIAPLLADPAAPRLTTYTPAGRMELSGQTLANWQSKVAHLLRAYGVQPGDRIGLIADTGWQPAVIAIGAWHVGAVLTDNPDAQLLFTDDPARAEASDAEEIFLLSSDPFGRGVEESGGEVPFGITDFSPEVRIHPDQYHAPTVDGPELAEGVSAPGAGSARRVLTGPWQNVAELTRALVPLMHAGSVVVSVDTATERMQELAAKEGAELEL